MRKGYIKKGILLCGLVFALYGCKDLIEESIAKKVVTILTPSDGTRSKDFTQTFWWQDVDGALQYRLQIIYNKTDSSGQFRLDTLLSKTKFTITLKPARYQWWVKAINGSSETETYTTQNLTIDSASISGQDIVLTSPANALVLNNASINFQWQPLPGATSYELKLYTTDDTIILDSLIQGSASFAYDVIKDSTYYWTVTGKNKSTFSNTSDSWNFTLDRISPDSVKLLSPVSLAVTSTPVTLLWTAPVDASLAHYEIYIYKTSAGAPFSSKYNPYSTAKDPSPLKTSFAFTEGVAGDKIIWKVKAVDKAGNKSNGEKTRTFVIQ